MPRFHLIADCTISLITEVEAATEEEALELVDERDNTPLWGTEQDEADEYWVTTGELDGPPRNIRIEQIPAPSKKS